MSDWVKWAIAGAVVGAVSLYGVKRQAQHRPQPRRYEVRWWGTGLVVTALVYVAFALVNGASARWILIETAGVVAFGLVAYVGVKKWPLVVGPAWLAHSLWDHMLHADGHPEFVPSWYVPACLGFDVVAGLVLLATVRYKPKNLPAFLGTSLASLRACCPRVQSVLPLLKQVKRVENRGEKEATPRR